MYGTAVTRRDNYEKTTKEINVRPWPRRVDGGGGGKRVLRNQTVRPGGRPTVTTVTAHGRSENASKNTLGTVDRAIRERNIFTALSKMPTQVRAALFEKGWIEKKPADVIRNGEYVGRTCRRLYSRKTRVVQKSILNLRLLS